MICDLAFTDPAVGRRALGITCKGTELLDSQTRSVAGKRYTTQRGLDPPPLPRVAVGNLLEPRLHGRTLDQRDTIVHNLAMSGDLVTGTVKMTGLMTRVWLPGGGTLLVDAGTIVRDAGTDEILHASANHPFEDYFSGSDATALAPLCAALS